MCEEEEESFDSGQFRFTIAKTMAEEDYIDAFSKITRSVVSHLENLPGVSNVVVNERAPAERHQLLMWEQQNSCFLPEDLKSFYMTANGLKLTWCIKFDDDILPIGVMDLNSIDRVNRVSIAKRTPGDPSADINLERVESPKGDADQQVEHPHFDSRSRIFELNPCRGCGKVCLVYENTEAGSPAHDPRVWFLDRSLRWHHLTDSFAAYFQLMLVHLGLPEWQYSFTDIGLSPQSQTWFHMLAPMRLAINLDDGVLTTAFLQEETATQDIHLDCNRVFKARTEKRSKSGVQKKKTSQNKTSSSRTAMPPNSKPR